jgi:hypothetical protein
MANQPLTLAVFEVFAQEFEAFQHKLFSHLDGIDRRLEALEQTMNSRFDELLGKFEALSRCIPRLEDDPHS